MKKTSALFVLPVLACIIITYGCSGGRAAAQTPVSASGTASYQNFYDNLAPYGSWIDYAGYGHVWHPDVAGDFKPYATNGNWTYTTDGWTWASNYTWGWAAFHYGRWFYDNSYGWLWIPGNEWSPAWVSWGSTDDFYCWAPLMPEVNVQIQFGSWRPPAFYWNACNHEHIYDHNLTLIQPERVTGIVKNINIINNYNVTSVHGLHYATGPDVKEVSKYTGHTIQPKAIEEARNAQPVLQKENAVSIYRPQIQHPQPQEFKKIETPEVKPVHSNDEFTSGNSAQQKSNVEHLQVQKEHNFAPESGRHQNSKKK